MLEQALSHKVSRRDLLRSAAGAAAFAFLQPDRRVSAAKKEAKVFGVPDLKELGKATGYEFGGLVDTTGYSLMTQGYKGALNQNFNSYLINCLRMKDVASFGGDPKNYTYYDAETVLSMAEQNGKTVEASNIIRGVRTLQDNGIPQWVDEAIKKNGGDPNPVVSDYVNSLLTAVLTKHPNVINRFCIVSEAINPDGGYDDAPIVNAGGQEMFNNQPLVWSNVFNNASQAAHGDPKAYMVEAFKAAHETITSIPNQTNPIALLINDTGVEMPDTPKGDEYVKLVGYLNKKFKHTKIKVEAGVQGHLFPLGPDYNGGTHLANEDEIAFFGKELERQLKRLAVPTHLTELDIDWRRWMQYGGRSQEDALRLYAFTMGTVIGAYARANADKSGQKSVMFYQTDVITGIGTDTFPANDPNSVVSQVANALAGITPQKA